jgi:hypothetical protein
LDLIQGREDLPAEQQPPGLGPRRAAQVRQRLRHDRRDLSAVVQPTVGREELERRLGLVPGRLGGGGLIPVLLGLTPQPVQRGAMTLA